MQNYLISTNPSRGFSELGRVPVSSPDDIERAVNSAREAYLVWRDLSVAERVAQMQGLYDVLEQKRKVFIQATAEEMGMPLSLTTHVTNLGFEELKWNIEHAAEALSERVLYEDEREINTALYEPYGVIACILPWNYPLPNFARSPAQALLAGNGVVIKYSEEIPLFSKLLEDTITGSDFPQGLVQFVYGDGAAGDALTDMRVDYISFTGSTRTGTHLYTKAAERLLPVELELGGSSPGVVFADTELTDEIVQTIFARRFSNSGQFCSGLKRLIVHRDLHDELIERLVNHAAQQVIGDALDPSTTIGPLVADRQIAPLQEQIDNALAQGATLHCGGQRAEGLDGAYYEPTILSSVTKDMRVWREEVFGPALPVIAFDDYDEAIALANDTDYGLSGFVFTQDTALAQRAMRDIEAGSMQHNGCNYQRPENPFGGYKSSGIGRQRGIAGFHHVSQIKVIALEKH